MDSQAAVPNCENLRRIIYVVGKTKYYVVKTSPNQSAYEPVDKNIGKMIRILTSALYTPVSNRITDEDGGGNDEAIPPDSNRTD